MERTKFFPDSRDPGCDVRPWVPSRDSFLCGVPSRALEGAAQNGAIPRLNFCGGRGYREVRSRKGPVHRAARASGCADPVHVPWGETQRRRLPHRGGCRH
eukprot:scaffold33769_cov73-Isochrysis_galbana.AAC.1